MNKDWINVKDQLPNNDDDVLVYHFEDDHITVGYFEKENVYYYIESDGNKFYTNDGWETEIPWAQKGVVTHWMPLPKKPQIKNEYKTALGKFDFPISTKCTMSQ